MFRCALLYPFLAILPGCVPALHDPSQVGIQCTTQEDCPADHRCAATISACVLGQSAAPPQVESATATYVSTVEVTFTQRMHLPSLRNPSHFTVSPALAVLDAQPQEDGLSVVLVTEPQAGGRLYTLTVSNVFDALGEPLTGTATFVGFGPQADGEPPALLAPPSPGYLMQPSVTLVWSPRFGAHHYTVEIARDPQWTQPVAGSPWRVVEPQVELTVSLPVGETYFWRVRANVTDEGAWSQGSFALLEDAIYVSCPHDKACEEDSTTARGGRAQPMRSLQRAIDTALLLGLPRVLVAGRGDAAYPEPLSIIGGGVSVEGGYSPGFSERDSQRYPTRVETPGVTAVVGAVRSPTRLSHLSLRSLEDSALSLGDASEDLVVEECTIESAADGPFVSAARVSASPHPGPTIRNSYITTTGSPGAAVGVLLTSGSLQLDNNRVWVAKTSGTANHGVGIDISGGASARIANNTVRLAGSINAAGLQVEASHVIAQDNFIELGASSGHPAGIQLFAGSGTLQRNRVHVYGASSNVGIAVLASEQGPLGPIAIHNNLISVGGEHAVGIDVRPSPDPLDVHIAHNTLVMEALPGPTQARQVLRLGGNDIVINNIIACLGSPETTAVVQQLAPPATFSHNALVGCDILYRLEDQSLVSIQQVNELDNGGADACETSRFSHNVAVDQPLAQVFVSYAGADGAFSTVEDNDLNLALASDPQGVLTGGRDTSGVDCGPCSALVSCGDITTDFNGAPRTVPVTIGAYEVDR